jgi:LmbE family N-acetylglucosaminyl deacetylase
MSSILIVAAHPDDEILGCGGTIARHVSIGDTVNILIVAEGVTSRDGRRSADGRSEELAALRHAAELAAKAIGAQPPRMLGLPDNMLDTLPLLDVIKPIEAIINEIKPQIVYTHHAGDLNVDHRVVHQAVVTSCRPLPESTVAAIYSFETLSSTEWQSMGAVFQPQRWVDIENTLDRKLAALSAYESEMRPFPHARSMQAVECLARLRGATAGLRAAECFMVLREIVK